MFDLNVGMCHNRYDNKECLANVIFSTLLIEPNVTTRDLMTFRQPDVEPVCFCKVFDG